MDEAENAPQESTPPVQPREPVAEQGASASDVAKDAAKEAAAELRAGAQQTLNDVKSFRIRDLFNFEKMVFPRIATLLYIVLCILTVLGFCVGMIAALVALVSKGGGFVPALGVFVFTILYSIFIIIGGRIWFEMILVAFKINEGIQDVKQLLKDGK